jgi:RNA polymerase sigma factor (sigma-70 family)
MPETSAESGGPGAAREAAFTTLLNRYQWPLYAFVRGFVGHDEQARDLTQDVFADAWRATLRAASPFAALTQPGAAATHTPDGALADGIDDAIRRWLFHAAYCRAISALRRGRLIRWESLEAHDLTDATDPRLYSIVAHPTSPGASPWAEPYAESFEERVVEGQALATALAALAPADVACLLLSVVQGFTTAEIAQVIETTPDAAKKRLTRAKQRLRDVYTAQNKPPADPPRRPPGATGRSPMAYSGAYRRLDDDIIARKERRA